MPGMMDTILNLGLNDEAVQGLIAKSENERFAYDSYRRFVQMFGNVVLNVDHDEFEHLLEEQKKAKGVTLDTELDAEDLAALVYEFKNAVKQHTGSDFPDNPRQQLDMARDAVFESSGNPRAITYRRLNDISEELGRTAVNVQAMVFGNMGGTSGSGVAFTRNPSTGANQFYGEFLINAQGEDVVAGIRTPLPVAELKNLLPDAYNELVDIGLRLEKHYTDMQDVEFTIQDSKLYMLQTRNGKRTGQAAVRIAVENVEEGLIDKPTALTRVPAMIWISCCIRALIQRLKSRLSLKVYPLLRVQQSVKLSSPHSTLKNSLLLARKPSSSVRKHHQKTSVVWTLPKVYSLHVAG